MIEVVGYESDTYWNETKNLKEIPTGKDVLIAVRKYGIALGRLALLEGKNGTKKYDWYYSDGHQVVGRIKEKDRVVAWANIPDYDLSIDFLADKKGKGKEDEQQTNTV